MTVQTGGLEEQSTPGGHDLHRKSGVDQNVLILAISLVTVVLMILFVNVSASPIVLTKLVIIEMVGLFMLIVLFASHLSQSQNNRE